jgi:hypothetical protein
MSTSVTNRLTINGNDQVKKFIKKLNQEFIKDEEKKGSNPATAVRRIIYGHTPEIAERLSGDENTKDINYYDETHYRPIESAISFISHSSTIDELHDYLLVALSRLDPWVLICNQYFDEYLTSITTRYSLMCDLSPAEIEIIKEVKVPNIQTDSFLNKFDKMAQKEKEKAFTLVQKKFNWIQDDRFL